MKVLEDKATEFSLMLSQYSENVSREEKIFILFNIIEPNLSLPRLQRFKVLQRPVQGRRLTQALRISLCGVAPH